MIEYKVTESKKQGEEMMLKSFDELSGKIKETSKTLVVAAPHDSHTLEAVFNAADKLQIRYILAGNREKIISISSELGFSTDPAAIIDCGDDADCACTATALIREGRGDALMKGSLETGVLLKAVLDKEAGIRGSGTLSHLAILEVPVYHKFIGITDGGMIPNPAVGQKADIAKNAAGYYRSIGYKCPKIAAICASEKVSPKMRDTLDAAELQAMCIRGELGNCLLEGPMSFDIAISEESALIKGVSSAVSGDADILLVPDITVGNVLAKGLIYWAGAKMAGCVLGAKAPIVLTSRGATTEEKLFSIMLSVTGG